jgi:pimeloyl-ACP methyl ester carboxylesterase
MARRLVLGAGRRAPEAAGHDVLAPTLTGLGDRAHLISPLVGLDTHVEDVVACLDYGGGNDVVLVGHSYAGQVIAARRPAGRRRSIAWFISTRSFSTTAITRLACSLRRSPATIASRCRSEDWAG